MKAIIKEWTTEDKFLMLKTIDKIHDILEELNDPLKIAFVTGIVDNAARQAEIGRAHV